MKLAEVLRIDSPSHLLSAGCSATSTLTDKEKDITRLKNFVSAFPHASQLLSTSL